MIPSGVPPQQPYTNAEMELRGQKIQRALEAERAFRGQQIKRDYKTPIPVLYIVVGMALLLVLIVVILGVGVFHFW